MKLANRELSWLSFNERVLQEALDETVPIIERMRFLGIYSNNMDEFFRVRVAYIRRMIQLKKQRVLGFDGTPRMLFEEIRNVVMMQQRKFQIAYKRILKELANHDIHHIDEKGLIKKQVQELEEYFNLKLKHAIVPIIINQQTPFPRLKDSGIYLAVKMVWLERDRTRYALIKIPTEFSRFYLMKRGEKQYVILLDDIIRLNLHSVFSIFDYDQITAYTFKFTRDAELDIDDDISDTFMEKIEKSVKKRKVAEAVRFVYDEKMPIDLLQYLLNSLNLKYGINTIPGGKYHNFKDFMSFPDFGRADFTFPKWPANHHPKLQGVKSIIKTIIEKDVMLHFPYQRFDYVVDLLREAAIDPKVKSIKINIYRVAAQSHVMNALMNAVSNGKDVTVILELQARFDEENNLYWANKLKEAGAKVSFGVQHLKVHSKLIQIYRQGSKKDSKITYIGTGNFHERTALIYEDIGLLTADPNIGEEVTRVFEMLDGINQDYQFNTLFVSPVNTRTVLNSLIQKEIDNAKKGHEAHIRIKLNNLVDSELTGMLYKASQAGVKVDLLIRGICCLVPGVKGLSENISAKSIIGRFLEHSRFMIFHNGGERKFYIASADWMERNLDKRVEVGCPIFDKEIQDKLLAIFDLQWRGNVKARIIDERQSNRYFRDNNSPFNAQEELYKYYQKQAEHFA